MDDKVARIEKRYAGSPRWVVTVKVAGREDFSVELPAPTEGLARTNAMIVYPHPLRGEVVGYSVRRAES